MERVRPTVVLLVTTALGLYATLWVGWVHDWSWLATIDDHWLNFFFDAARGNSWWIPFWRVLCFVFAPASFYVLGAISIWFLVRAGKSQPAWFLLVTIGLSGLVTEIGKRLADRPRPATAMVHAAGTSFPSGHALGVLVGVVALLVVWLPQVAQRWRALTIAGGAFLVVLIGVARVALNVHHPSDILAGWLLGFVWLTLCLWLVPPYKPWPYWSVPVPKNWTRADPG